MLLTSCFSRKLIRSILPCWIFCMPDGGCRKRRLANGRGWPPRGPWWWNPGRLGLLSMVANPGPISAVPTWPGPNSGLCFDSCSTDVICGSSSVSTAGASTSTSTGSFLRKPSRPSLRKFCLLFLFRSFLRGPKPDLEDGNGTFLSGIFHKWEGLGNCLPNTNLCLTQGRR